MLNHKTPTCSNLENKELLGSPIEEESLNKRKDLNKWTLERRIDGKTNTTRQTYTVENVSEYLILDDRMPPTIIECPSFSSGAGIENDKWFWRINIYHDPKNFAWIEFYANCAENDIGIRAIISIYVVDNEGNEIFAGRHGENYRYNGFHDRSVGSFFHNQSNINKEKFLPNNSLTVRLELTILLDDITPFPPHIRMEREPKANLPSHFKELYLSRENTGDLVIKVKDQLFRVHNEVLKIRYPQLLDLFAIQVLQGKDIFQISDLDCDVFEKLLEFFYLDEVTDIDDCIVPLWKAAHKYQLTALKSICEKIISEDFLSVENVDMVKDLAIRIGSQNFCYYIFLFIRRNKGYKEEYKLRMVN